MKRDQRGFTIVELLVSIGILAVVAPLLATGMFQILTYTERARAGFEAQADTRTASGWMSQDIVMAQAAYLDYADGMSPTGCNDAAPDTTFLATFTWTDWFRDPESEDHFVSYCWKENQGLANQRIENQLLRFYDDCSESVVIGRNIESVGFTVIPNDPPAGSLVGQEVTIDITSVPERNRYQVRDRKIVQVKMRPMPGASGQGLPPCPPPP